MPLPPYVREYLINCGGIVASKPDESIEDNELADARNVVPGPTGIGSLKKRRGISKYTADAASARTHIGSIYAGLYGPYYTDQSAAAWDIRNSAGTSIQAGTGTVAFPCWRSFSTYDLVVDGTNAYKSSNGTSFTTLANIPTGAKYIESYNQFLCCAGHNSFSLRWADITTLETWTAANELKFDPSEGDHITGLKKYGTMLAVFLQYSFHFVQGYSGLDFTVVKSITKSGAMTFRSVIDTPFGLYWWSDRGLCGTLDGTTIDTILLRKLGTQYLVPPHRVSDIHGIWDSVNECVHMYFPYPSGTACNTRLDYYPRTDSIYLHDGAGCAMACSAYVMIPG
jgi:hypothetical protein